MSRRARSCPLAVALLLTALLSAACSGSGPGAAPRTVSGSTGTASTSASPSPTPSPAPPPPPELPRGGRTIFPANFVVMHYGTAGTGALGVLGEGTPEQAAVRLEAAAAPFGVASGRPVLPAFEFITTVASDKPDDDGDYSVAVDPSLVQKYYDVARANKMLFVMDFQPGRADFLDQVKRYESFLRQPDVGIALDPEWKLTPTQRPNRQVGTTTAAPVNAVSDYLARLVAENNLPEKLFIVHQFQKRQIPDRAAIVDRPGLATVLHVDGFGTQADKFATYAVLASTTGQFVNGFKLFLDEDTDLLTPAEVVAMRPMPELVSYQ